jgi:large-conductance mechanosensitive channel
MDDSPKAFLEELRSSILKKRVGQIVLAVVLAEAVWRLINALTWYLIIPIIGRVLEGHTESVLFEGTRHPFPFEALSASFLEFMLTVIVVFYLNRWIHAKSPQGPIEALMDEGSSAPDTHPQLIPAITQLKESEQVFYNIVGEPLGPENDDLGK